MIKFTQVKTEWIPYGGGLLVIPLDETIQKGTIIVPDAAKEIEIGYVHKASAPSTMFFHPGDQVIFFIQGAVEVILPGYDGDAYIVMPKAVMLHLPVKRKNPEII